ncbi:MAG: hypothetical protein M1829_000265 [Trizodia sp. TS-e1964]|nr:MAG: hypothetical protein M1829_000265 [Trizodia sp. TS-e1964]
MTALFCTMTLGTAIRPKRLLGEYGDPDAIEWHVPKYSEPVSCEEYFEFCPHQTIALTRAKRLEITIKCWPYATDMMRRELRDPKYLCEPKIYTGLLADLWPDVPKDIFIRYSTQEKIAEKI